MIRSRRSVAVGAAAVMLTALVSATSATSSQAASDVGRLVSRGSTSPSAAGSPSGAGAFRNGPAEAAPANAPTVTTAGWGAAQGRRTTTLPVRPAPRGEVGASFRGLNIVDNVDAAGFSLEPPDQGLCVGNGKVLEVINAVGRVYNRDGSAATDPFYLNTFFKEDPITAFSSDPSCFYDQDTKRFFADMLMIEYDPASNDFTGRNWLDIAVSDTSDPAGSWQVYQLDVTADGNATDGLNIGDYPQLGVDREGVYLTTNSYPFFEDGFGGAQLYAMSKRGLTTGTDLDVTHVAVPNDQGGAPFTLRPTTTPVRDYAREFNGTEYMLSSQAGEETGNTTGTATAITLWGLRGTNSLAPNAVRRLSLVQDDVRVDTYGTPPASDQKKGPFPLGQCLTDAPCLDAVFGTTPAELGSPVEHESTTDSSDTRMHQTLYSHGLVYGSLDTVVHVAGKDKAGVAWYVVRPGAGRGGTLTGSLVGQGRFGVAENNVTFPAFGISASGQVVMGLSLMGEDYYPSAGYVTFDRSLRPSAVHVVGLGAGPQDGFSMYAAFGDPRPRYGDYAATAIDPATGSVWIANEYVDQRCTLKQFTIDSTCGGTRSTYANWATRISEIRVTHG